MVWELEAQLSTAFEQLKTNAKVDAATMTVGLEARIVQLQLKTNAAVDAATMTVGLEVQDRAADERRQARADAETMTVGLEGQDTANSTAALQAQVRSFD